MKVGAGLIRVRNRGYTLLELMITLAIAAILLTVTVPAYRVQRLNAHMTAASTDIISNFMSARAESVGRNTHVTVCKRNEDGNACVTDGNWEQGWLTFVSDSSGSLADPNDIIQIHRALPEGMTVWGTSEIEDLITYHPNGLTSLSSTQRLVLCDERGFDEARGIVFSIIGKGSVIAASEIAEDKCVEEAP